jgi:hypothetical protein
MQQRANSQAPSRFLEKRRIALALQGGGSRAFHVGRARYLSLGILVCCFFAASAAWSMVA